MIKQIADVSNRYFSIKFVEGKILQYSEGMIFLFLIFTNTILFSHWSYFCQKSVYYHRPLDCFSSRVYSVHQVVLCRYSEILVRWAFTLCRWKVICLRNVKIEPSSWNVSTVARQLLPTDGLVQLLAVRHHSRQLHWLPSVFWLWSCWWECFDGIAALGGSSGGFFHLSGCRGYWSFLASIGFLTAKDWHLHKASILPAFSPSTTFNYFLLQTRGLVSAACFADEAELLALLCTQPHSSNHWTSSQSSIF